MFLTRFFRRFQMPAVCLAMTCVLSLGCRGGRWGQENVQISQPQHAYAAEDGSLLMGFHVKRKVQAYKSGWHWVVLSPEHVQQMREKPSEPHVFDATGKKNRDPLPIVPGLLKRGLESPTPPDRFGAVVPWTVVPGEQNHDVLVFGPDQDPDHAYQLAVYGSAEYASLSNRLLQVVKIPLLVPALAAAAVLFAGFVLYLAITGKSLGWGGP